MELVLRKTLWLGLCLFFCIKLSAQEDSLRADLALKIASNNHIEVIKAYSKLGVHLSTSGYFSEGWKVYLEDLAYVQKNFEGVKRDSIEGSIMSLLGLMSLRGGVFYEEGAAYYDTAIVRSERFGMYQTMIRNYVNHAHILRRLNKLDEAIVLLDQCQLFLEEHPDYFPPTFYNTARVRVIISNADIYAGLGEWGNALEKGKKALDVFTEVERGGGTESQQDKGHVYNAMAIFYSGADSLELADYYSAKSVENYETAEDPISLIVASNTRANILKDLKRFDEARQVHERSIRLSKEKKYLRGVAIATMNIGHLYYDQEQYQNALINGLEAERMIKEGGLNKQLPTVYNLLVNTYEKLDRYEDAYHKQQVKLALEDSVRSLEVENQLNEFNVKYETLEKENQLAQQDLILQTQEATIASQNTRMIGIGGAAVVLLLIGLIYYNRSKAQQKAAYQTSLLTEKEKGLVAIVEATEIERKRISKDLHDGIGQQLSALKLGLQKVKSTVEGEAKEELEVLTTQFSKSADEVRQISHQMMPRALMENGLVEAVGGLLQNSFRYADLDYTFEHHGIQGRFDERVEVSLYRILQELVNNVIKHSEATTLSVQLIKSKARLMLLVEDNGKGLGNKNSEGHGLLNIKNRLDMINGEVNFEPSPQSGVLATVVVPV